MKKLATTGDSQPASSSVRKRGKDLPAQFSDSALLDLHRGLQGSLNVGLLVNRYFDWLLKHLPVSAIEYSYPEQQINIKCGQPGQHRAHYVLRLEHNYLGEVSLSAQWRMAEQHQLLQEQSMGVLVHYIKNAVDYIELERVAFHDSLTGAMNRTALDELLPKEVDRASRYDYALTAIMFDIDHFKAINDRVGHLGGDRVLNEVLQLVRRRLRSSDLIFRYGGDEFLAILPSTKLEAGRKVALEIMSCLEELEIATGGQTITPEISVGVISRRPAEDAYELLRRVDTSLYDAKKAGRNRMI